MTVKFQEVDKSITFDTSDRHDTQAVHEEEGLLHICTYESTLKEEWSPVYTSHELTKVNSQTKPIRQIRDPLEEEEFRLQQMSKGNELSPKIKLLKPREEAQLRMVRQKFSIYNQDGVSSTPRT